MDGGRGRGVNKGLVPSSRTSYIPTHPPECIKKVKCASSVDRDTESNPRDPYLESSYDPPSTTRHQSPLYERSLTPDVLPLLLRPGAPANRPRGHSGALETSTPQEVSPGAVTSQDRHRCDPLVVPLPHHFESTDPA